MNTSKHTKLSEHIAVCPTTYTYVHVPHAPDHIYICSRTHQPHPHMWMTHIHICTWPTYTYVDDPHTHMWMTLIHICGQPHMLPTTSTYAPDHIHICGQPHTLPNLVAFLHMDVVNHICSRPHPHMLPTTSSYVVVPHPHMLPPTWAYAPVMYHIHICSRPHTHMWLPTCSYAPHHMLICGCFACLRVHPSWISFQKRCHRHSNGLSFQKRCPRHSQRNKLK